MPDDYDDDDDASEPDDSAVIKELRKQLKAAEKDAHETPTLRKQLALHDAGLGTLSELQRKALLATIDGDVTTDALKEAAKGLGFTAETEAPPEAPQVSADEQAAHQRAQEATSTAPASEATVSTLEQRIAEAKTPDELHQLLAQENMLIDEQ